MASSNTTEMQIAVSAAVDNLIGNDLDDFVVFASGSTPSICSEKVKEVFSDRLIRAEVVKHFTSVCLIAAFCQRETVKRFVQKYPILANLLMTHFLQRNDFNFSMLNMIGHCIITVSPRSRNPFIMAFNSRLRAANIWEADLTSAQLSETQRRILSEKKMKYSKEEVMTAGIDIVNTLNTVLQEKLGNIGTSTSGPIPVIRGDNATRSDTGKRPLDITDIDPDDLMIVSTEPLLADDDELVITRPNVVTIDKGPTPGITDQNDALEQLIRKIPPDFFVIDKSASFTGAKVEMPTAAIANYTAVALRLLARGYNHYEVSRFLKNQIAVDGFFEFPDFLRINVDTTAESDVALKPKADYQKRKKPRIS